MKFRTMLFLLLPLAAFLTGCGSGTKIETLSTQFAAELKAGWNLGNTLDANSTGAGRTNLGLSTETSWGMPAVTKEMIHAVAVKGFSSIRIPVSWHNHITDSDYTIDSQWFGRVREVVDWALEENLKVIINIHHDNLTEEQMESQYGFCVTQDSGLQKVSEKFLEKIWTQVAGAFRNYDENLIFEVLNEPRCIGTSYEWSGSGKNISDANKVISGYEQTCVNAIRSAGGRNSARYLMVPPYAASPDLTEGWTIPEDSAEDRLLISLHAYTPYEFAMGSLQNSVFLSRYQNDIDHVFTVAGNFMKEGYGVVIGEASASDKNNDSERKRWASYYFKAAVKKGVSVFLWDNMVTYASSVNTENYNSGECHGWFNRSECTWYSETIIDEIINICR